VKILLEISAPIMSGVCGKLGAGFSGNEDTKAELLLIESLS